MLTWCEVLTTFRRINGTVSLVMPVADIYNINNRRTCRISEQRVLYIFGNTKGYDRVHAGFIFPFFDHVDPELYKMKRTGKFLPDRMYHTVIISKIAEAFPDIGS